jgi:urease accessory protein
MEGVTALEAAVLERGDGAAELGFVRRCGVTRVDHLYQRAPCRILSPRAEPGEPLQAVVVTTSGGLADGDRLRLALAAGEGAAAQVTTQAAEKVYRARGTDPARFDCDIGVGGGAWLEWLPQETILFDGARLERRTRASIAPAGRLLACEHVVLGRVARGESFTEGSLFDRWDILRDGRLVWCDALALSGDMAAARRAPWGFAGAEAFATVLYVADDASDLRDRARVLVAEAMSDTARAGVTVVNGILVARFLGGATAVRTGVARFIAEFRAAAGGFRPVPPRLWTI